MYLRILIELLSNCDKGLEKTCKKGFRNIAVFRTENKIDNQTQNDSNGYNAFLFFEIVQEKEQE